MSRNNRRLQNLLQERRTTFYNSDLYASSLDKYEINHNYIYSFILDTDPRMNQKRMMWGCTGGNSSSSGPSRHNINQIDIFGVYLHLTYSRQTRHPHYLTLKKHNTTPRPLSQTFHPLIMYPHTHNLPHPVKRTTPTIKLLNQVTHSQETRLHHQKIHTKQDNHHHKNIKVYS